MSPVNNLTTAQEEYQELQNDVLDWYDVDATARYIDIEEPAMQAHILEAGSGDPVLLLHGGGDIAMIWAPLLARLQTDYLLYAPDRPGCGLTDGFDYDGVDLRQHATDFVCSTLDSLGIDQANVIASSAGGYFAFAAALARPERFQKIAMVGYPLGIEAVRPVWSAPPAVRNLLLVGGIPGFGKLFKFMQSRMDAETAREFYESEFNVDVSRYPDIYFEAYAKAVKLPGAAESFISFIKNCFNLRGLSKGADLSDDLQGLAVPTLILWGEQDLAPPEDGREICAELPNVTFEVAEDSGHYPFNDMPDWTADRVRRFLSND